MAAPGAGCRGLPRSSDINRVRRSQKEPEGARRSQKEPEGARRGCTDRVRVDVVAASKGGRGLARRGERHAVGERAVHRRDARGAVAVADHEHDARGVRAATRRREALADLVGHVAGPRARMVCGAPEVEPWKVMEGRGVSRKVMEGHGRARMLCGAEWEAEEGDQADVRCRWGEV